MGKGPNKNLITNIPGTPRIRLVRVSHHNLSVCVRATLEEEESSSSSSSETHLSDVNVRTKQMIGEFSGLRKVADNVYHVVNAVKKKKNGTYCTNGTLY